MTRENYSFFGDQEGDFSIEIHAIAARREIEEDEEEEDDDPKAAIEAAELNKVQTCRRSWFRRLLCGLI